MEKKGFTEMRLYLLMAFAILASNICVYALVQSVTPLSPPNSTYTSNNTPTFNFSVSSNGSLNITCTLMINNATSNNVTGLTNGSDSSITKEAPLSDGTYNWSIVCTDADANVTSSANRTITIDTINPSLTIILPQNTTYTSAAILINISSIDDNLNQTFYLNSTAGNETYSSPTSRNYTDGAYTIYAYTRDHAGNTNSTNVSFSVDTTPPGISLDAPANTTYTNRTVSVIITSPGSNTLWFTNASGQNLTYTENTTTTYSSDGQKTIYAYANDSFGNINSTNITFSIDTTPPAVTLVSPTNTTYASRTVAVTISAPGNQSVWFTNAAGQNETYNDQTTTTFSSDGPKTIYAYANDSFGNVNSTSVSFSIDTAPPTVTVYSPTTTAYASRTVIVNLSSQDSNAIWFTNASGTNVTYSSATSTTYSSDGSKTMYIYANDSLNNVGSTSVTFTVDTVVPVITEATPSGSISSTSSASISVTTNESASCKYDTVDTAYTSMSYSLSGTGTTHTGTHAVTSGQSYILHARCADTAGNKMTSSTSINFSVNYASSGGSGGGGGGSIPTNLNQLSSTASDTEISKTLASVPANQEQALTISNENIGVTGVEFTLSSAVINAKISVKALAEQPVKVKSAEGSVFQYLEISKTQIQDSQFVGAVRLKFKVSKQWLRENNVDPDSISMNRYSGGSWTSLATFKKSESLTSVFYESETPGFSYFAISGKKRLAESPAPEVFEEKQGPASPPDSEASGNVLSEAPAERDRGAAPKDAPEKQSALSSLNLSKYSEAFSRYKFILLYTFLAILVLGVVVKFTFFKAPSLPVATVTPAPSPQQAPAGPALSEAAAIGREAPPGPVLSEEEIAEENLAKQALEGIATYTRAEKEKASLDELQGLINDLKHDELTPAAGADAAKPVQETPEPKTVWTAPPVPEEQQPVVTDQNIERMNQLLASVPQLAETDASAAVSAYKELWNIYHFSDNETKKVYYEKITSLYKLLKKAA